MLPLRGLSHRAALARLNGGGLATVLALRGAATADAQNATPVAGAAGVPLPDEITAIIEAPMYTFARWGNYVADRQTGETVYDLRSGERFLAASTTKLYPAAAALAAYGSDYRFETPVCRSGAVGTEGTLAGDLILVASGDPTMGGRTTPDRQIAFTPFDHVLAKVFPTLATLTPENPLAGLDDIAKQIAAAGIWSIDGDVLIDARLFPAMEKDAGPATARRGRVAPTIVGAALGAESPFWAVVRECQEANFVGRHGIRWAVHLRGRPALATPRRLADADWRHPSSGMGAAKNSASMARSHSGRIPSAR